MQRAKRDDRRPMWMKEEIWDKCIKLWETDKNIRQSETNKANRAVAKEKGIPAYRGGSISTSVHKKRLVCLLFLVFFLLCLPLLC